ncbi:T9SS type B sorting domain-containing protein [Moheibacter sediminis]|uniref:Gliding motility-associated C-terminal domain-containing protein n=1 Tax=Moheibacter sediminis TaxID=1434700 RepID=A0A1W1ZKL5_9FLAO|nr:T9SS type B sorting domain-containing protein [Moheibacter sediminis]SMC48783.1 gliding motility-associated C-terminal domain-containing protein [Moheibacter sediminis]
MQVLLFWGSTLYGQQTTCIGSSHIYRVDENENGGNGTTGSTYSWTVVEPAFQGTISNIPGFPSGNQIEINWGSTPEGQYTLIVTETFNGCSNPQQITVTLRDGIEIDTLEDLLICPDGGSVTFNAGFGYDSYAWYNDADELLSTARELTVEIPGTYRLEVRSANCAATELVEAVPIEFPIFVVNTDVYNSIVVEHIAGNVDELEYQLEDMEGNVIKPWQVGNIFNGVKEGIYIIRIRTWDASCYTYKTAITVSIPNAITPNGDGYNDHWDLSRLQNYAPDARVEVYDRYGKFIHALSKENNFRWDGYYLGRPLPSSSYVYIMKIGGEKFTGYLLIKN